MYLYALQLAVLGKILGVTLLKGTADSFVHGAKQIIFMLDVPLLPIPHEGTEIQEVDNDLTSNVSLRAGQGPDGPASSCKLFFLGGRSTN